MLHRIPCNYKKGKHFYVSLIFFYVRWKHKDKGHDSLLHQIFNNLYWGYKIFGRVLAILIIYFSTYSSNEKIENSTAFSLRHVLDEIIFNNLLFCFSFPQTIADLAENRPFGFVHNCVLYFFVILILYLCIFVSHVRAACY